jgi:HNH endonuclease
MIERARLLVLNDEQLVAALSQLVRQEQGVLADLLAHLAELDERRLYLELGYSSLFAYCTEALGFCKSSAGRRIAAARVCRKYPQALSRVAKGELRLSVLSLLGSHLDHDTATELFEACSDKSFEQVELLLAARFPRPDVKDLIRRLPARPEQRTPNRGSTARTGLAPETDAMARRVSAAPPDLDATAHHIGAAARDTAATAAARDTAATTNSAGIRGQAAATAPAQRRLEPLSPDRFGVHFTADGEFRELLDQVRALASHGLPDGDLLTVMKRGLKAYRRELLKARFGLGRKPQRGGGAKSVEVDRDKRTRHVPAALARQVYVRDDGRCTFCAATGRRCSARAFLEIDHILPWAVGGGSTLDNLRLRCHAHNQHAAREYFGRAYMRDASQRSRSEAKMWVGGDREGSDANHPRNADAGTQRCE